MKYLPNLLDTCSFTRSVDFHKLLPLRFISSSKKISNRSELVSYDTQLEMCSFFGSEALLLIYSTRHFLTLGSFIKIIFPYFVYEDVLVGQQERLY